MPNKFPYDVFISYNSKDKAKALKIAEGLKKNGLKVWFDDWVIKPGDDIFSSVEQGLEASRALILCMSKAAFDAKWVSMERNSILFRNPANEGRRFIPLLLEDCEIPSTILRFKYIDYRSEKKTIFQKLLKSFKIRRKTAKPIPPPSTGKQIKGKQRLATFERKLVGHTDRVNDVAVSKDGKWVVSGSNDKTLKIWDIESGECKRTLKGHKAQVASVSLTPDGRHVLSASDDKTIGVWDFREANF